MEGRFLGLLWGDGKEEDAGGEVAMILRLT